MSNSNYFSNPIPKLQKINQRGTQQEIYESFEEIIDSNRNNASSHINNDKQDHQQSTTELQAQIAELKQEYQNKLKEIDQLYKEILKKDEDIRQINQRDTLIKEDNLLKMSYMKKIKQLERDSNDKLQQDIEILKDDYQMEIQIISEEHDEKVKKIQDEMNEVKGQIKAYNNKQNYITKEEHDQIIFDLRQKHQKELEPFEREIAELEQYISDNYPQMTINKEIKVNSKLTNQDIEFFDKESELNMSKDNLNTKSELNTINNSCIINNTPSQSIEENGNEDCNNAIYKINNIDNRKLKH